MDIVKYDNKLNEINLNNFEQMDLNFLFKICVEVRDKQSDIIEIPFEDLKKSCNYRKTDQASFLKDIIRMNAKLQKITGKFENEDEVVQFNLFSTFRTLKSKKILQVRVNPDFVFLLNDLSKNFTKFEFQELVSLKGIHAKKLYTHLKQFRTTGTYVVSLEDIKKILGVTNYVTKNVTKQAIEPAVEELKEYFKELHCEVLYEAKRGRPVKGYKFSFVPEKNIGQQKQKKKTKFSNFLEREYTTAEMDDLEVALLKRNLK